MNINWKFKSFIFGLIDKFSLYDVLYFLQKNVTKRSVVKISEINDKWMIHQNGLATLNEPVVLEFGAGKSLSQNIYLGSNFKCQTVVDLFPMLDIDMFNEAALQISKIASSVIYTRVSSVDDIERCYGIKYIAPLDVARAPFSDNFFDGCISTNTLEHIPKKSIIDIFKELKRIIKPGGLISAVIDYSDHYSHTDKNIGAINYLMYSSDEFSNYNHVSHYQNRLRHYDYEVIFRDLLFEVLKSEARDIAVPPRNISEEFNSNESSLCATWGVFLLKNIK